MHPRRSRRAVVALGVAALGAATFLTACGSDSGTSSPATTPAPAATTSAAAQTTAAAPTTAATQTTAAASITISGAWARSSPAVASAGAVYFEMTNDGDTDDALLAASVDASVAKMAELHETVAAPDGSAPPMTTDGHGGMTPTSETHGGMTPTTAGGGGMTPTTGGHGGMMTMHQVDRIPIPAKGTVVLKPGGYHVMLMELAKPLEAGQKIEVTLTFEHQGTMVIEAEVRDTAP